MELPQLVDVLGHLRHLVAYAMIAAGVGFTIVGAIGVLRFPDFYTRMHAAGITDTLGAELAILGLMLHSGFTQTSVKLAILGVFLFLTSPTSTHAVANAALRDGIQPLWGRYKPGSPKTEPEDDA